MGKNQIALHYTKASLIRLPRLLLDYLYTLFYLAFFVCLFLRVFLLFCFPFPFLLFTMKIEQQCLF